jgi:hypothetical protein
MSTMLLMPVTLAGMLPAAALARSTPEHDDCLLQHLKMRGWTWGRR